jgi:hypothetical protein
VVNIRVTCDIDNDSSLPLLWSVTKGLYKLGRFPDRVRLTERGYHVIYKNLDMTEEESMRCRLVLGDDANRVKLDKGGNRIKQVLFTFKTTTCLGYIHPVWLSRLMHKKSPSPNFDICPFCLKKVKESSKIWEDDQREIEIVHEDGTKCVFPLKTKSPFVLRLLKRKGVNIIT